MALTLKPSSRLLPWLTLVTQLGSGGRFTSACATSGTTATPTTARSAPATIVRVQVRHLPIQLSLLFIGPILASPASQPGNWVNARRTDCDMQARDASSD